MQSVAESKMQPNLSLKNTGFQFFILGTTAILNRAINTMRPGNLAEMEDLRELSGLLRRAGWPDDNTSDELKKAISYGRMVQKYVTDGSGTHDMIHAAVGKLKKAMKQ